MSAKCLNHGQSVQTTRDWSVNQETHTRQPGTLHRQDLQRSTSYDLEIRNQLLKLLKQQEQSHQEAENIDSIS
jgi:hypothetical protein